LWLPASMVDWLPEDDIVSFIIDVVQVMDTLAFDDRHHNDGAGCASYHADMRLDANRDAEGSGTRARTSSPRSRAPMRARTPARGALMARCSPIGSGAAGRALRTSRLR
jgi:hypothetical protein